MERRSSFIIFVQLSLVCSVRSSYLPIPTAPAMPARSPFASTFGSWFVVVLFDVVLFLLLRQWFGVVVCLLAFVAVLVGFAVLADGVRRSVRCPSCGREAAHVAGRAWMCPECGSWTRGPDFEL